MSNAWLEKEARKPFRNQVVRYLIGRLPGEDVARPTPRFHLFHILPGPSKHMIVFAILMSNSEAVARRKAQWLEATAIDLLPFLSANALSWRASQSPRPTEAFIWLNGAGESISKYVTLAPDGLSIRQGWTIGDGEGLLGEYLHVNMDAQGNATFRRNLCPVYPLYFVETKDTIIISNRSVIAAAAANESTKPEYDDEFVAGAIGCGWPLLEKTLFKGVRAFRYGEEPSLRHGEVILSRPSADPWKAQELVDRLAADPDGFWDERISELDRVTDLFFDGNGQPLIAKFPLSSGKDSRLLFAVMNRRTRFREVPVSTHGSLYHADAVVAAHIANHYGMRHQITDSVFQTIELGRALPEHLFLSEGRCSPSDLISWRATREPGFHVIGHELGLRDPIDAAPPRYSVANTFAQLRTLFNHFDRLNVLHVEVKAELEHRLKDRIQLYYDNTDRPENVAWRFFMENRVMHYVALVKMKDETQRDSPYALMTDPIVQTAYSIGLKARLEERVHYELLRRLDPWLTYHCPFGSQRWPLSLRVAEGGAERFASPFPAFSSRRAPSRGTYAAYDSNRDAFRSYILDNLHTLDHVVDRSRVEAATLRPSWNAHEMAALWYLVEFCGGIGADWKSLSPTQRGTRPEYFPKVAYSNARPDATPAEQKKKLVEIYQDVTPGAIFSIAREAQAKELMREAHAMWAQGLFAPAFNRYAAAAVLGEPYGYFILGRCYLNGDVVARDRTMGLRYLDIAREAGVAAAATVLGNAYAGGDGVSQDTNRAIGLYRQAINLGDFWAYERVARLVEAAGGDATEEWAELADTLSVHIQQNEHPHAYFLLGTIHLEGKNGCRNRDRGIALLEKARQLGSKQAAEQLAMSH